MQCPMLPQFISMHIINTIHIHSYPFTVTTIHIHSHCYHEPLIQCPILPQSIPIPTVITILINSHCSHKSCPFTVNTNHVNSYQQSLLTQFVSICTVQFYRSNCSHNSYQYAPLNTMPHNCYCQHNSSQCEHILLTQLLSILTVTSTNTYC